VTTPTVPITMVVLKCAKLRLDGLVLLLVLLAYRSVGMEF